jgi:hypothetical protein
VIAVRNVGESVTTVTATVPYSKQNGETGNIALPQISLEPGDIKLLETSNTQLKRADFATAGLEIKYTGAPGSVIAAASSVSQSGNHVFAVPMKDPQGGLSSTGGYPWFIKDTASTVVFIKNVTDQPQDYILSVVHSEGVWRMKPRLLDPRQTIAIDVKKLRDSQEKGMDGDVMPTEVTSGHISWGARGKSNKKLIGRAQMVDFENGMASTYECQCQCPPSWAFGAQMVPWDPGALDSFWVGDNANVELQSRYYDCFGNNPQWFTVYPSGLQYSFSNPNVAIFGNYQIIAVGAGSAFVDVGWGEKTYTPGPCESGGCEPCAESDWTAWASESVTVQSPRIRIFQNGNEITNPQNVIVGQHIGLSMSVEPPGATVSNRQWTVPGTRVANYVVPPGGATGTLTPLTNLSNESVNFYWVDGGDGREVTISATVQGVPVNNKATFNVKRPTVSNMTINTGEVQLTGAWPDGYGMWFGVPTRVGISFSANVSIPSGFTGNLQWVQIWDKRRRIVNSGIWYSSIGIGLDSQYPYATGNQANDSPGLAFGSDFTRVITNDSFFMFYMFQPTGVPGTSIWVPLKIIPWGYDGEALKSGSSWAIINFFNPTNVVAFDTTDFPTWTQNAASIPYRPE